MKYLSKTYLLLVYGLLYIPIAILIAYSFNNATYSTLWHGFSWRWYQTLMQDDDLLKIALNSLTIASLAAALAVIIGTWIAITLYRYKLKASKLFMGLIFLLIIFPDIVFAIAFLILFYVFNIPLDFSSLLIAHVCFCIPFVTITVYGRLIGFDEHLLEAASDLGATDGTIFLKILLPLLLPAVIVSVLLCFTLSLDDVIISFFVTGPSYQVLPLEIYSLIRLGVNPEINALCTILFMVTLVFAVSAHLLLRKNKL